MEALKDGMRKSADLRLLILHSYRNTLLDQAHPEKGFRTEQLVSATVLTEQARGSTDPLLLDLLLARCDTRLDSPASCDRLDIARRWTEADKQNQVAWLALASVQRERGDVAAAHASVERAALASVWREHQWDVARLVEGAAPSTLSSNERLAWQFHAVNTAFVTTSQVFSVLTSFCREESVLHAACLGIAATSSRDGDTLITLKLAAIVAVRAHAPEAAVAAYRQRAEAIYWAVGSEARDMPAMFEDYDEDAARIGVIRMRAYVTTSERVRGERFLIERHVSESDAAARYVASLSEDGRAARERMLRESRPAETAAPR